MLGVLFLAGLGAHESLACHLLLSHLKPTVEGADNLEPAPPHKRARTTLSDPNASSSNMLNGGSEGETAVAAGTQAPYPLVKRDDYVRLLIQALCDLGLKCVPLMPLLLAIFAASSLDLVGASSRSIQQLCLDLQRLTHLLLGWAWVIAGKAQTWWPRSRACLCTRMRWSSFAKASSAVNGRLWRPCSPNCTSMKTTSPYGHKITYAQEIRHGRAHILTAFFYAERPFSDLRAEVSGAA